MPASGSKVKATKGIEKNLFMQAALYCDIHYNGWQGMENLVILSRTGLLEFSGSQIFMLVARAV
jgi:hypothetical protein